MHTFEFYRFRFHFHAIDAVEFPPGKSANVVRGALGLLLRDTATPAAYQRLFEPGRESGRNTPSGLTDWPRPFVLRATHLDGVTIAAGGSFFFDVHVFDLRAPVLAHFRSAFAEFARKGIGVGRGRAGLDRVEQLDLADGAWPVAEAPLPPLVIGLDPDPGNVERVGVRFLTPTELKCAGGLAERPEFPILFSRLRDRLSTLRALYGAGPLDIDFRALGERAGAIRLVRCDLAWEKVERKSGRTGQVHPLGGFLGEAVYEGDLAEFVPWLRAARWVGVGRQTVWGKGEVRVEAISSRPSAISSRPSALSSQPSAASYQPSASSPLLSAISGQPSALTLSHQRPAISPHPQPSDLAHQLSAISGQLETPRLKADR